ncbi:lipid A export permease/ATP-binding protein MsbA [Gilvimarinus sp. F26214L]|uniref:lipid A export permease/ATP-binding protein MsbA n=1 Tax=Gilvimarinus sp. DZF01 TaxID=3461371 RepID=UPI0040451B2F
MAKRTQAISQNQPGQWRIYLRLLSYLRPHLFMFSLNVLGFFIYASTQPMLAKLTEFLIGALENRDAPARDETETATGPLGGLADKLTPDWDWLSSFSDELLLVPYLVVFIYLLRGIGLFVGNYAIAVVAENIVHSLRTEVFNKLTTLPSSYFDEQSSGHLISKITYNVAQVTVAATEALKIILREGFTVVLVMAYLFYTNWKLTMVFVAIAPVIALFVSIAGKRLRRISGKLQTAMGAITSISSEMIGGYRVMRSFGGEEYEKRRFRDASRYTYRQNVKMVFTANLATSVNQFIVAIALGALMLIAISFIGTGGAAELVGYMVAVGLLPKAMRQLSDVYGKIQKGLVAAHSVFEQIDEPGEKDEGRYEVDRVQGKVEFENLSFIYPGADKPALESIDLVVAPGTTVALVGRSGSGKSTLVSLIPRYYDHTTGAIRLDDREINEYSLASLRRQIALVTQDVVLFNDTVHNNIAYGDLATKSREEVIAAARNAHALEFIDKLPDGLDTQIGEDGTRLSGGQRQRLSIARAFLKDAPVLILDEATSALDSESENLIQDALEKVVKNRTTFVIAHRLSTIENADKIVVMEDGHIVEVGSHRELLAMDGAYAKLHAGQFKEE